MNRLVLAVILFLTLPVPVRSGDLIDPKAVERRYGPETMRSLRLLTTPPAGRNGLVDPETVSRARQLQTYRSWIMEVIGREGLAAVDGSLNRGARRAAAEPNLAPVREMLRNALRGEVPSPKMHRWKVGDDGAR